MSGSGETNKLRRFLIGITSVKTRTKDDKHEIEGVCTLTIFEDNICEIKEEYKFEVSAGPNQVGMSSLNRNFGMDDVDLTIPKMSNEEKDKIYDMLRSYLAALEGDKTIYFWSEETNGDDGWGL